MTQPLGRKPYSTLVPKPGSDSPTASKLHAHARLSTSAGEVKLNIPDDGERDQHYDAKPPSLLGHVQEIVRQREQVYGPPVEHWGKAAEIANILFGTKLDAETWGKLWIVDKLVRDGTVPQRDNLADIAGYADGIDRIRSREG